MVGFDGNVVEDTGVGLVEGWGGWLGVGKGVGGGLKGMVWKGWSVGIAFFAAGQWVPTGVVRGVGHVGLVEDQRGGSQLSGLERL
jgi:hypothetical protein